MLKIEGKSVFGGIAVGKIRYLKKENHRVVRRHIEDTEAEVRRYEKASRETVNQLHELYEKAVNEVGENDASIFMAHQLMLQDVDFVGSIENMIRSQQINAEFAVAVSADNFASLIESMDDEYMKERAVDIRDVSERLIRVLSGRDDHEIRSDEPMILVCEDLTPSETVQLDKSKILAFVTHQGSSNSHTAILARTMNIPALVGVEIPEDCDGEMAVVDGISGIFYIHPDEAFIRKAEKRRQDEENKRMLLQKLRGKENRTHSGKKIEVYANIGSTSDVVLALQNDAGGIGLFRSEFLYLQQQTYPTEEEQFHVYKTVAETMAGKKVIFRTLDIGADKKIDYFNLEAEENPALGYRAIRICLDHPELFKTQLRALFRAAAYGNISIMYPMVISVEEVKKIRQISDAVRLELYEAGVLFGNVEEGIMIETPAAALISDQLSEYVDFFSIGTNDLSQYTLAIDRQNLKLERFFNSKHEAVLRLIRMTVENAHKAGIWVGICGELGADLTMTEEFIKMGIDELSVAPAMILPLREKIRELD